MSRKSVHEWSGMRRGEEQTLVPDISGTDISVTLSLQISRVYPPVFSQSFWHLDSLTQDNTILESCLMSSWEWNKPFRTNEDRLMNKQVQCLNFKNEIWLPGLLLISIYICVCVHVGLFAWAVHLVWSDQSQQLLSKHFCSKHHPRQKCMFIAVWKAKANASRSQCLVQINDKSNFFRQLSQPLARAWLRKTKGENHQSGDNGSVPFGDRGWFGLMSDGSHKKSSAAYSYYRRTKILRKFR